MMPTMASLLAILRDSLRTRVALQAEVLALRHQLVVLAQASFRTASRKVCDVSASFCLFYLLPMSRFRWPRETIAGL